MTTNPQVNQDRVQGMDDAFTRFVNKAYEAVLKGEKKIEDFVKERAEALQKHEQAKQAVQDGGPKESDEDYRKRLLPIAGDDSWKQRIEQANGPQLDALGSHYNKERNVQPTQSAQPKDEADRAEKLASQNRAPEDGVQRRLADDNASEGRGQKKDQ